MPDPRRPTPGGDHVSPASTKAVEAAPLAERGVSLSDMAFSAARVTHLPPLCDRAYRRNCNVSATEVRQLCIDSFTGRKAPRWREVANTADRSARTSGSARGLVG